MPAGLAPGTRLPIRARVDYLACTDEVCVPETANVAVDLEAGPAPGAQTNRALFDRFRQALPRPLGSEARFERAGNRFRLAIPLPAGLELREPYFYPLTDGALSYAAAQTFSRAGDTLIVETDAPANGGSLDAVEGVLKLSDGNGLSLQGGAGRRSRRRNSARSGGQSSRLSAPPPCWPPCSAPSSAGCCSTSCPASSRS